MDRSTWLSSHKGKRKGEDDSMHQSLPSFTVTPPEGMSDKTEGVNERERTNLSKSSDTNPSRAKKIKRKEVLTELLETERDYVENLKIILDLFLNPIKQQNILTRVEIASLFSNVEALYEQVNVKLLSKLELLMKKQQFSAIGQVFLDLGDLFKLYAVYCSNQPNIHGRVVQFKDESERFSEILKIAVKDPRCRRLDIEAFLIIPLQRLCKYPMLLKELLKNTEEDSPGRSALEESIQKIQDIVNQVNERVRKAENINKLISISKILAIDEKLNFDILADHNRVCYMDGPVKIDSEDCYLYLFNDVIIFSRDSDTGREGYALLQTKVSSIKDIEDTSKGHLFELCEFGKKPHTLEVRSKLNKKKWLAKFDTVFEKVHGSQEERDRLLETYKQLGQIDIPKDKKIEKLQKSSSQSNSPRLKNLWKSTSKGPSVKKIAEIFETPSQDPIKEHIKKLNTSQKERRILELENFGNALNKKCQQYKTSLKEEKSKNKILEESILSLQSKVDKLEKKIAILEKEKNSVPKEPVQSQSKTTTLVVPGNEVNSQEELPGGRKRSIAMSQNDPADDARFELMNDLIESLTKENELLQLSLDECEEKIRIYEEKL